MTNWRYWPEALGALAVLLTLAQMQLVRGGQFGFFWIVFLAQIGLYAAAALWRDHEDRIRLAATMRNRDEEASAKAAVAEQSQAGPDLAALTTQYQKIVAQRAKTLALPEGLAKQALQLSNDVLAYWGARESTRPVSGAWGLPPEDQAKAWALERQEEERFVREFFADFSQQLMPRVRAMLEALDETGVLVPSDKQMQSILLGFNDAFHQPDDVRIFGERLGAVALRGGSTQATPQGFAEARA